MQAEQILANFAKFLKVFINREISIFRENNYICKISRLRASKLYIICSYFKSLTFYDISSGAIGESFREILLTNSRNQNIFKKLKINRNLQMVPFKMMYNMSMLRHLISNER